MRNEQAATRPWWKLGPMTWLGILLLAVINIAVFTDWLAVDRRSVIWFVYCCDPHRWPTWITYPLWGAFLWQLAGLPRWPKVVHQLRWIVLVLVVIGIAVTLFLQYDVHTVAVRRKIYDGFYVRYFVAPYANYLVDGQFRWTMLITPMSGTVVLGSLIFLAVHLRKKRKHVENNGSDPS